MKRTAMIAGTAAVAWAATVGTMAVTIDLAEYAFNVDGTVWDSLLDPPPEPAGVDVSSFDTGTGLGTITYSTTAVGAHYFAAFLDHEIDQAINTFFNEVGAAIGTPGAGQSWEIDEPGWTVGNIFANFSAGSLDNAVGQPGPEDVSMALGWNFILGSDQEATIALRVADSAPLGFYLQQTDPDSGASLYFSGDLTIRSTALPDGGTTLVSLGLALLGLMALKRK
jgi:hypothetical protein